MCYNEIALICAQIVDSILGPIANIDAEMHKIVEREFRDSSLWISHRFFASQIRL